MTAARAKRVVIATVPSDSHMWNLVYIELVLRENGCEVINLGPCTPVDVVVDACVMHQPDVLVVTSVNGHGHIGGKKLIDAVRARPELDGLHAVIGGKLGTLGVDNATFAQPLLRSGYSAVFTESQDIESFARFIDAPRRPVLTP